MTVKHPYISATGAITQALTQFRKNVPVTVDAPTLKKYGIAPNNESYLINTLKFIGVIDEQGQRTDAARAAFVIHDDDEFASSFAEFVEKGYADLFSLYGQDAWSLPKDKLISFFRQSDETSDVIGSRQANTFAVLAQYAKKRDGVSSAPAVKKPAAAPKSAAPKIATTRTKATATSSDPIASLQPASSATALTVRIEVNLPAGGDQATYDAIFKSIRANLIQ